MTVVVQDLIELAGRCEKATGPDREIANDVLFACGWTSHEFGEGDNRTTIWTAPRGEEFTDGDQPDPTGSIDAAMTLVPEAHAASVEWSPRFPGYAWLYPPDNKDDVSFEGNAATPALALCAAALRARASIKGEG